MIGLFSSLIRPACTNPRPSFDTRLEGARITLKMPTIQDWDSWRHLRETSKNDLIPWEPKWPKNSLTYGYYRSLVQRYWRDWRAGKGFAFAIFKQIANDRPVYIGGVTLGSVHYAAAQKATIGYWIGTPYSNQGLMTEAVGLVCGFAFSELRLHRVEASCLPHNERSKKVLLHCGFEQEGYAKEYLEINGRREDHILWGISRPQA